MPIRPDSGVKAVMERVDVAVIVREIYFTTSLFHIGDNVAPHLYIAMEMMSHWSSLLLLLMTWVIWHLLSRQFVTWDEGDMAPVVATLVTSRRRSLSIHCLKICNSQVANSVGLGYGHTIFFFFWLAYFLIEFLMQVRKMDPQLPIMPEDFPSSADYEPLPFLGTVDATKLRKKVLSGHPLSGYGYFCRSTPASLWSPNWMGESTGVDMSDFQGKGTPKPEFQPSFRTNMKDDISRGHEVFAGESLITTLLMIWSIMIPRGYFPPRRLPSLFNRK